MRCVSRLTSFGNLGILLDLGHGSSSWKRGNESITSQEKNIEPITWVSLAPCSDPLRYTQGQDSGLCLSILFFASNELSMLNLAEEKKKERIQLPPICTLHSKLYKIKSLGQLKELLGWNNWKSSSDYHSIMESLRLGKTSKVIESNIWLNTLSTKL